MTNIQGSVQACPPRHARGTHKPLSSAQSRAQECESPQVQTEENASECDCRGSSDKLPCAAQPSENCGIQKRAEDCVVWPFAIKTSRPDGFAEDGYLPACLLYTSDAADDLT